MPTPNDYSNVNLGPDNSGGKSGEYGAVTGQTLPEFGSDLVPTPGENPRIFSSKNGNPQSLHESTRAGIEAHADFQYTYGLCSPVATPGSHSWLRDDLTNPGQKLPGNEIPHYTAQIARRIEEDGDSDE